MKILNFNSQKISTIVKSTMVITLAIFMAACKKEESVTPQPTSTIMEIVDNTADVSTLKAAIDAAGLRSTLNGDGPFTVFAPTNEAFEAFQTANPGVLEYLLSTPDELAKVLTYHVVADKVASTDLVNGTVPTVNGESVTIDLTSGVKVNDASVVTADIDATNGIIHLIDKVLVPENVVIPDNLDTDGNVNSIAEIAIGTEDLSTLVSILSLDGLSDILEAASDDNASLTVFAPTNEAFDAVLDALGLTSIDEIPENVLLDIVKYHIIGSVAKSTDLQSTTYETLNGESVTVDLSNGVKVDDANVVAADIMGSNGVVHVVDAVLLPSLYKSALGTIVEVPLFRKEYSILTSALVKADLVTTLLSDNNGDKFTVFAPNNDAFEAAGLSQSDIDALDASALSPILLYHVLGSEVLAADLPPAGGAVATLNTDFPTIYLSVGSQVFINGTTEVVATDITKSNGVIHAIDKTLMPPTSNIVEIAQSFNPDEFTQLVAAVARTANQNPDYLAALSGSGDFTVFAPTDAAFQALLDTDASWNTIDDIPLATLTAVLGHHVIASPRVFSTDLTSGTVTTLNGDITIDASAGTITDGSGGVANLTSTVNVLATNGVIHVIDKVLLP